MEAELLNGSRQSLFKRTGVQAPVFFGGRIRQKAGAVTLQ